MTRKDSGTDYIKGLLQGQGGGSARKVLASQTQGPEFESQRPGEKAVWDTECNLGAGTVGWAHQPANLAESSNSRFKKPRQMYMKNPCYPLAST